MEATESLPQVSLEPPVGTRWFRPMGAVQERVDGVSEVFVGGLLIGSFRREESGKRDVLIVLILEDERVRSGELARAFGISGETLRLACRRYEKDGLAGVVMERQRGAPSKVTPALRAKLRAAFDAEQGSRAAARMLGGRLSEATIRNVYSEFRQEQIEPVTQLPAAAPVQCELLDPDAVGVIERSETKVTDTAEPYALVRSPQQALVATTEIATTQAVTSSAGADAPIVLVDEAREELLDHNVEELSLPASIEAGGSHVQHLGSWIVLGMLHAMGVYHQAARISRRSVSLPSLRVALDAVAIALMIGQRCVEGVRRLATPSAPTLLRHTGGITASWARRVLHRFADVGGALLHLAIARSVMLQGHQARRMVLYVDNHMRPYTGEHTVRKGWRMQDKRAVPGTSDYYVHDAEGDPVFRVPAPGHGSLAHWLGKIVDLIRVVLGDSAKQLLLVFDRGGAFPSAMAELRGRSVEFVTYERAPYPLLTDTAFDRVMRVRRGQRIEQVRFTEGERKNLREGRGRVRRIVLKMQDGRQVNVLAVSKLSAPTLVRTLLARWGYQENQFKHEVERWGINQLDGRRVEPYPEDAIIPNPARRLLDFRLRLAYAEEGRLRRRIARVTDDRKRQDYEHQLHRVLDHQRELLELRPSVPKHAPVSETSLAGVLVRHTPDYKYALDGLRVALANIESELAAKLAVALPRGTEAKKTLANLLMAPGVVRVNKYATRVILAPAASAQERKAFRALLRDVNRLRLTLPGDPERRIMRFEVQ